MLSYQFAIWKSPARIEDLGNVPLSNDRDAFAFAKRVIRERLMHKDAERVAASVISKHSAMSAWHKADVGESTTNVRFRG
jgi:hypothetical protein